MKLSLISENTDIFMLARSLSRSRPTHVQMLAIADALDESERSPDLCALIAKYVRLVVDHIQRTIHFTKSLKRVKDGDRASTDELYERCFGCKRDESYNELSGIGPTIVQIRTLMGSKFKIARTGGFGASGYYREKDTNPQRTYVVHAKRRTLDRYDGSSSDQHGAFTVRRVRLSDEAEWHAYLIIIEAVGAMAYKASESMLRSLYKKGVLR